MKEETCLICKSSIFRRGNKFICHVCGHWFTVDDDDRVIDHEEIDPILGSYDKTFGRDE